MYRRGTLSGIEKLEVLDVERRQVHVVDQMIEAAQVRERGLFDDGAA
jgi:hypothetical protein